MAWLRIDDRFCEHPKVQSLGNYERMWTWLEVLSYTCRQKSPVVPEYIQRIVPKASSQFITRCIDVGLIDEEFGEMVVHDWKEYQQGRVDPTAAERQARWRQKRNVTDSATASAMDSVIDSADGDATAHARAVPDPDPVPQVEESDDSSPASPPAPLQRGTTRVNTSEHKEVTNLLIAVFGEEPTNDSAWGRLRREAKSVHQSLIATGLPKEEWEDEIRRRARALYFKFGKDKSMVTPKSLGDHWHKVDASPAFAASERPAWIADVVRPEVRSLLEQAVNPWPVQPGWWWQVDDPVDPLPVERVASMLEERAA